MKAFNKKNISAARGNSAIRAAKNVIKSETVALQQLLVRFPSNLPRAVAVLERANGKIITAGIGKSGIAAQKMAATLSSYGIAALQLSVGDALHGDVGVIQCSDALILVSQSGTSAELEHIAQVANTRGVGIVGVFGTDGTRLAKLCSVVLVCKVRETACPIGLAPMAITAATTALLDGVSAAIAVLRGISKKSFAENHPMGLLGRQTNLKVSDVMLKGRKVPKISVASQIKDALLEMCRCEVGAVCVVSGGGTLKGLITDGDIRRALLKEDDTARPINEVMNPSPKVLSQDTSFLEALELMESREKKIYVVPVIDKGKKIVGLLRLHDLLV